MNYGLVIAEKYLHPRRGGGIETIITDPPFGMSFISNHRKDKYEEIQNDHNDELLKFACELKPIYSSYVFCRWDNIYNLPKPKSLVTWVKNNWSMGDLEHEHARQTETILFYAGSTHQFPSKRPTDIIECARTGNNFHPTEKPIELMKTLIGLTFGNVLDPFMGSGSTGVACAKMGRRFIGIELDEKHFDTACKRIEAAYAQPDLFVPAPEKLKQTSLL